MANTVSNTTSSLGGNQQFGATLNAINSGLSGVYNHTDIMLIDISGDGVISGEHADGTTGFFTARSIIKTLDLIGEGEIEGIVSGEYIPSTGLNGAENVEGQIGYQTVKFEPYSSQNPESFLRSVYLNDTPVVNSNGYYNFQASEFAMAFGTPSGVVAGDNFLYVGDASPLEKTRTINERLRGPDLDDTDANNFYYYPKVYRFLNSHVGKIRVNFKIPQLTYTKVSETIETEVSEGVIEVSERWPTDQIGQIRGSSLTFKCRHRPIFKDADGNVDLNVTRQWSDRIDVSQVEGTIKNPYLHSMDIVFDSAVVPEDQDLIGWEIEVVRTTLESIESHISNQSYVDTITEIFDSTLSYPNSAIVAMNFNAEYFSQIPNRAYDVRLLKVKVPGGNGGYEPLTRTYNENPWAGDFQSEKKWTDNPAWIFYDLCTNPRYGLGKHLGDIEVDKWTLYEISKFCDTLVSDGQGGLEPRFTCNVLINTREEAFKVLKDFASCFRSIIYYGLGRVNIAMDKPKDPVALFNNANVLNGDFSYASSAQKSIPTVCLVRYNDKDNFYKPAIEYIENTEGIRKHGVREKEVTAFACTSRSQAIRLGRWMLSTELEQTETVRFTAGPEGMLVRPGDVVRVTDSNRSTDHHIGRAIKASATSIVLDRALSLIPTENYTLCLTTPNWFYDESIVNIDTQDDFASFRKSQIQTFDFSPSNSEITVTQVDISGMTESVGTKISSSSAMFSTATQDIVEDATWSITKLDEKSNNLYRVLSTKENTASLNYSVEALVHNSGKFAYLESGILYSYVKSPQNITASPPAPTKVELLVDGHPDSNAYAGSPTKRIQIKVKPCDGAAGSCDKGTTVGYKIYGKGVGALEAWSSADFIGSTSIPKDEFLIKTIYLSDNTDNNDNPLTYYQPSVNQNYVFKVYSINSVGSMSTAGVDGKPQGSSDIYISVTDHYPVRDVQIHSLRLASDFFFNQVGSEGHNEGSNVYKMDKEWFKTNNSKDARIQWNASFLNSTVEGLSINYYVSIHEPSDTTASPGNFIAGYETSDMEFNFSFERNKLITDGPKRRFDMVVTAIDQNGVTSSGVNNGTSFGWDIIEVLNPKPTGYAITPRLLDNKKEGIQYSFDTLYTDQYIDSDGFVHIDLLTNTLSDLAGGYAYVSRHPFSGADFNLDGSPKIPEDRSNLSFEPNEEYKSGEYVIDETNFEAEGDTFGTYNANITFKPTLTGEFSPPYYLAFKFYDSFDKEIKDAGSNNLWNKGLLNNLGANMHYSETGLYLGFARDTTGSDLKIVKKEHCLTTGSCGLYLNDPDVGTPTNSNTFSSMIAPTKYYSANQGGFKTWIRMNINGQWEGQGVSHVRALTQKDVQTLYNYKGFYEYACRVHDNIQEYGTYDWWDSASSQGVYPYYYPDGSTYNGYMGVNKVYNPGHESGYTKCHFRMAQGNFSQEATYGSIDSTTLKYWGGITSWYSWPRHYVYGATRHDEIAPFANNILPEELQRAGIAYQWGKNTVVDARTSFDKINSYNERGQLIAGKSRPLRGFRRFRVYFDENNLPEPNSTAGLASYAVVGVNCWNGEYESWTQGGGEEYKMIPQHADMDEDGVPDAMEKSVLFAKDGYNVFPSSVQSFMNTGDLFENIPGVWNHHPAGFGQGFGGLVKTQKYFDIHMGRMIDDSYLNEAMFGVLTTNDYGISSQLARLPNWDAKSRPFDQETELHEVVYYTGAFVTQPIDNGGDGAGHWTTMY